MARATTKEEADRIVERWHLGIEPHDQLHDALGWTWEEYARWTETGALPAAPREVPDLMAKLKESIEKFDEPIKQSSAPREPVVHADEVELMHEPEVVVGIDVAAEDAPMVVGTVQEDGSVKVDTLSSGGFIGPASDSDTVPVKVDGGYVVSNAAAGFLTGVEVPEQADPPAWLEDTEQGRKHARAAEAGGVPLTKWYAALMVKGWRVKCGAGDTFLRDAKGNIEEFDSHASASMRAASLNRAEAQEKLRGKPKVVKP